MHRASEFREEIAIVGMAGRFPGARNTEEFWNNLCNGIESISFFTAEELRSSGVDPVVRRDPTFVSAAGLMDDADCFDASFFGVNQREAEIMDPQHRAFLECAWAALENAGVDPGSHDGVIGVFGGVGPNTYLQNNIVPHRDLLEMVGSYQTMIGNEGHFPTTRVSYKLNLKGPSINVQTACSTSGVAIHLACQSLLSGECDMALAGGARIKVPLKGGYFYQEDGIPSPDGHCRAFDAQARGTVYGSGVAIIVLKRLSDAIRDGDRIDAVIKGSAVNNDGSMKAGFTAPSVQGQAAAIAEALAVAEIEADTVGYVEAHGTGTALGDPIEIAALTKAFRESTDRKGFCAIGSVKTNIGHLDAGAGVAGVIKAALALKYKLIPPSLNFEQPNPQIDFDNSPFYVNAKLAEWRVGTTPRRAGVSSFGLGGTNVHIILEEAPVRERSGRSRPWEMLTLSARSSSALDVATANLVEYLKQDPDVNLADVAHTLHRGRRRFSHRRVVVCQGLDDAVRVLGNLDPKRVITAPQDDSNPSVVFMFPGGGAQYVNMARELYREEPVFRQQVDECLALLTPQLNVDLATVLFPSEQLLEKAVQQIRKPSIALPLLFAVEYAMARLLMSWGIRPAAMIGHSMGEYTAACLANVLSLEDALSLVDLRGRLFEGLPDGAMLSVPLPEEKVRALISSGLSVAAVNRPSLCVVSGNTRAIDKMEGELSAKGIDSSRVHISVAAHSEMVEPILPQFGRFVEKITLRAPSIPYVSNVTGTWITAAEATDPAYWLRHLRETVRFADGLQVLLEECDRVLLEVGPGQTLSTFAKQHPARAASHVVLATLRHPKEHISDVAFLLNSVGRCWLAGTEVDWSAFHDGERRQRVALPTYPFERKRYWLDPPRPAADETCPTSAASNGKASSIAGRDPSRPTPEDEVQMSEPRVHISSISSRKDRILRILKDILHDLSGADPTQLNVHATFLEMGFDSLFLTRANAAFQRRFKVRVTFRQLFEESPTLATLADYIDDKLLPDELREESLPRGLAPEPTDAPRPRQSTLASTPEVTLGGVQEAQATSTLERVITLQLQVMAEQLRTLRRGDASETVPTVAVEDATRLQLTPPERLATDLSHASDGAANPGLSTPPPAESNAADITGFGPFTPVKKAPSSELTPRQREQLQTLIARYTNRTKESKRLVQHHRPWLADARTVSGFRALWKELVYPIVTARSSGAKVWDVDGNEYVDVTMGFGASLFGHSPRFVIETMEEQLRKGIELGGQSPLAGKVAEAICEFTGMDRVAFANTGSEAVLGAVRAARTVTGRDKIALFAGSYHGRYDGVMVKAIDVNGKRQPAPQVPGIPSHMVQDVLVLDYGDPRSLDVIRANAADLASVLVEPVQSRNPSLQPREFLHALRELTAELGIALIFDEVITGFRVHPGGAQAWFGVQADLATYGKALGGGMPIAVVAGRAAFMDAFDGGMWKYGDASFPESGVTFLGGTFIRHPLALAGAWAVLSHLKQTGPRLQRELNEATERFACGLNDDLERTQLPIRLKHFGSLFIVSVGADQGFSGLLFPYLREKRVHIYEDYPCFLSTAHTQQDIQFLAQAIKGSAVEMQEAGFLLQAPPTHSRSGEPIPPGVSGFPTSGPESEMGAFFSGRSKGEGADREENRAHSMAPTEAQMEIWLATRMGPDASRAFHQSCTLELKGQLNVEALRAAIQRVVLRHEALRMTFSPTGDSIRVSPDLALDIPFVDCSRFDAEARRARVTELLSQESDTTFELTVGPLLRAKIVRLTENDHLLLLTVHHIICDGWSIGVVVRDLSAFYDSAHGGAKYECGKPMQYSEYVRWQEEEQRRPEAAATEAYWLEQFSEQAPVLELPTDLSRPPVKTYRGGRCATSIDRTLHKDLKRLAARQGCTLFSLLLAAYGTLLHRLSAQEDVVIGISAAGQSMVEGHDLVGHCVNFLPLRSRIVWDQTFAQYLKSVGRLVVDAYDHQNYTYGTLIKKLRLPRDAGRLPLVSATFTLESAMRAMDMGDLCVEVSNNPKNFCNFDLEFYLAESESGLTIEVHHNLDVLQANTVQRWVGHYRTLLQGIVANPHERVGMLAFLTEAERRQLLIEWNGTDTDHPNDRCIHELFEAQVERRPDTVAVVFEDAQLTYRELNRRANQLAHHLRARGVGPDVLVGICVERSVDMVVALLGVLKAGGAYVPLDPAYPKERLSFMLEDAQASVLLTQQSLLERFPTSATTVVSLDTEWEVIAQSSPENPISGARADNLAYVIYTSGSTGRPKGVAIEHRSAVALVHWARTVFPPEDFAGVLASTSICFDLSVFELFVPLSWGGRVILAENALQLAKLPAAREVTLINTVPSAMAELLRAGGVPTSVRTVCLAGEPLSTQLVTQVYAQNTIRRVFDLYGPSETTTYSTYALRRANEPPTIGRPIANTQIYLLDAHLQPVPVGVPGELYIGGAGVARGYLNRPELTAEKFIRNPFSAEPGARVYKTGDLARYRPDGHIEFLGRIDHQVKLRGFRIELGEIETVLTAHPGVRESMVLVREDVPGDKRLVAYVVLAQEPAPSPPDLRHFLRAKLPDYMVPAEFVFLDRFPLTPNGKVDRRALPAPAAAKPDPESGAEDAAPRTPMEIALADIWKEVLGLERVGLYDNFFDLGGHSLLAMRVIVRFEEEQGVRLSPRDLMLQHLGQLAAVCEERIHVSSTPVAPDARLGGRILRTLQGFVGAHSTHSG